MAEKCRTEKTMLLNREIQDYFCNKAMLKVLDNDLKTKAIGSFAHNGIELFLVDYYKIWQKKEELIYKITKFNLKISHLSKEEIEILREYFVKNRSGIELAREKQISSRTLIRKISRIADKIISC